MKKYKVRINGENFLMNFDGVVEKLGFYTTRYVEAANEKEAESLVIDMLREDSTLVEGVVNEESDSPMMYVEGIYELESFDGIGVPGGGFTFYSEES